MKNIRVRFAPSPTGALHIGGVRTALYNYLLARKTGGTFILRIEDTDQTRYVPGAEEYIIESLRWLGLEPEEGPGFGGEFGPYRQSDRKELYGRFARQLVDSGHAYYAFDSPEELDARREAEKEKGNHNFKYDATVRTAMRNSLSLPPAEVDRLITTGVPYTIRLKVPQNETIRIDDFIRGEVSFESNELDDKVLLKADGMPTYHLANIVDDHLMQITHVIRGEEWLPSTAHHVLLYRSLGWESDMPRFAHLPLILKPNGKGKLSKRDGVKLGIPVFPLAWEGDSPEDSFTGFREFGFDPRAVINFLAFLGWNPGTEQELFSVEELAEAFSLERIGKAGARFDFDKARWFNQQYLQHSADAELAKLVRPFLERHGHSPEEAYLTAVCGLMKERITVLTDLWENGYYFFEEVREYDEKTVQKKWSAERRKPFEDLVDTLRQLPDFQAAAIEAATKEFMQRHELKFGDVLPMLRIALSGTLQGPAVFDMMAVLGQERSVERIASALQIFEGLIARSN